MAVPVLEAFVRSTITFASAITMVAPSGITAGELLIIIVGDDYTSTNSFNTTPSGWNKLDEYGSGTSACVGAFFWKIATGSEGNVTITPSTSLDIGGWYCRISGEFSNHPFLDRAATVTGATAGNKVAPSVTTPIDDCLAFYGVFSDGGDVAPFGQPTGWTEQDEFNVGGSVGTGGVFGTKTQSTAGATGDASISVSSTDGAVAWQFAIGGLNPKIHSYTSSNSTSTSSNITINFPPDEDMIAGDVLIMVVANDYGSTGNVFTADNAGWTKIVADGDATSDSHIALWAKVTDGTETTSNSVSANTTAYMVGWICVLVDVEISSDIFATATAFSNPVIVPEVTTTADGALVIYGIAFDGADAVYAQPTGWTEMHEQSSPAGGSVGVDAVLGSKIQETAGATGDASVSTGASTDGNVSFQIAFPRTVVFADKPSIAGTIATSSQSTAATTLVVTAPSGITAGELLVIFVGNDEAIIDLNTITTAESGWTKIRESGYSGVTATHMALFIKVATGSEGSVTFDFPSAVESVGWYFRMQDIDPFLIDIVSDDEGSTESYDFVGHTTLRSQTLTIAGVAWDGADTYPYVLSGGFTLLSEQQAGTASTSVAGYLATYEKGGIGTLPDISHDATFSDGWSGIMATFISSASSPLWPDSFARKCKITIDNTKVSGSTALTDFPVLITHNDLPDEVLDTVASGDGVTPKTDGADFRFSADADGNEPLAFEIVHYTQNATPSSATAEIWVKVTSVSDSVDTDIYLWWGSSASVALADNSLFGKYATWSDYEYVSHGADNIDSTQDRTGGYVVQGTPTDTTNHLSVANRANEFSAGVAEGYYLYTSDQEDYGVGDTTIQLWGKNNNVSSMNGRALYARSLSPDEMIALMANPSDGAGWMFVADEDRIDADTAQHEVFQSASNSAWHMVHGVANPVSGVVKVGTMYVDGSETGNTPSDGSGWGMATATDRFYVGHRQDLSTAADYEGDLAELRIRRSELSSDWVATEYNNQIDDGTFLTAGTPGEANPTGPDPISDTMFILTVDASANALTTARADAIALTLLESPSFALSSFTRTDTLLPAVDEVATILIALLRADILSPKVEGLVELFISLSRSDTVLPKILESTSGITNKLDSFDYLQMDFPDEDYTYSQVETNREDENLNTLFKFPYQAENYGLVIGDFDTFAGSSFGYVKTTADIVQAITQIFGNDTLSPKIVDEVASLVNMFQRTEAINPKITESVINMLRSTRSDTLTISLAELTVNLLSSNVSDDLRPQILETFAILVQLSRTDDIQLLVESLVAILAAFGTSDTLFILLEETMDILSYLSRSDILLPKVDETLDILSRLARADTIRPKIDETLALLNSFSAFDNLYPKIVDIRSILTILSRSDILAPKIDEAIVLLNSFSAFDNLYPKIVDIRSILTSLSRTDDLAPKIDEAIALLNSFSAADNLYPKVIEVRSILTSLSRSDDIRPKILEAISSLGTVTATDELLPKVDSIVTLLVSLLRADELLPRIDSIASMLVAVSGSDTLSPTFIELAEILWYTLEAFRFREDDGSETTAAWLAAQDTTINRATELNTRLRLLFDTNSDAPGLQLKLQYRPVGDPDWEWRDIV